MRKILGGRLVQHLRGSQQPCRPQRSLLQPSKLHTWYPSSEEEPILLFLLHVNVTLDLVLFTAIGLVGGPGKVSGSGDRKNPIFGFVGDSSLRLALQMARPLSELAIQVNIPLSPFSKSAQKYGR